MNLPRITNDALDAVEDHRMRTRSYDTVARFTKEQPELCQRVFEISQGCGWTEDQYSAAMTICQVAFDALSNQISLDGIAIQKPARRLG